jgi:flagellar protein FlaG
MNQINAINSGKLDIAQAGVTQANRAAALKHKAAGNTDTTDNVEVSKAVASAYQALNGEQRQYFVEEDLDKMVMQIVNADTKELVRQIPTEEALLLSKKLQDIMALMA